MHIGQKIRADVFPLFYFSFSKAHQFSRNIGQGTNEYRGGAQLPRAYNNFTIPANVSAKSYVRISSSGEADVKATNTYAAASSVRTVQSDTVVANALPYSMNMSVTRGNQQVDNYYTAV